MKISNIRIEKLHDYTAVLADETVITVIPHQHLFPLNKNIRYARQPSIQIYWWQEKTRLYICTSYRFGSQIFTLHDSYDRSWMIEGIVSVNMSIEYLILGEEIYEYLRFDRKAERHCVGRELIVAGRVHQGLGNITKVNPLTLKTIDTIDLFLPGKSLDYWEKEINARYPEKFSQSLKLLEKIPVSLENTSLLKEN